MARTRKRRADNHHALQLLTFLAANAGGLSPLLILTHDYPDPDALASAWGLQHLAGSFGVESRIVYGGVISRAENQAMVRLLKMPIRRLKMPELQRHRSVALVDTQPAFENNPFPATRRPAIVIDQHEPVAPLSADLALVDTGCGATCVIVAQALLLQGGEMPDRLATALAYGILSDTLDLYRVDRDDVIQTYLRVLRRSDIRALARIQNSQRSRRFFTTVAHGLQRAVAYHRVIVAHLGPVASPEDVAHVADFLLTYDRADWSLCTGRMKGRLSLSLRTGTVTLLLGYVPAAQTLPAGVPQRVAPPPQPPRDGPPPASGRRIPVGTGVISGTVVSAQTGRPLRNARVSLTGIAGTMAQMDPATLPPPIGG